MPHVLYSYWQVVCLLDIFFLYLELPKDFHSTFSLEYSQ